MRPFLVFNLALRGIFQSTHPTKDETALANAGLTQRQFQSTHPTKDETGSCISISKMRSDFNPLIQRRMRQWVISIYVNHAEFQSTHPTKDETYMEESE